MSSFFKSMSFAISGLKLLIQTEKHFQIHCLAIIPVLCFGWYFSISITEWMFIVVSISLVLITEALNTGIENAIDLITQGQHHLIAKAAKDISAGAVLCASICAIIIGMIIFLPKCLNLFIKGNIIN